MSSCCSAGLKCWTWSTIAASNSSEDKLLQVESHAAILIANPDRNVMQAEMELSIQAIAGLVRALG